MADKKTIAVLTGSRADWGLLEPLVAELYKRFSIEIIITGSHLSVQFGETWKDIPKEWWVDCIFCPIIIDWDNPVGTTKSQGLALMSAPELLVNLKPDLLLVLGDRYEVLSFTLAAYNLHIPVAHLQSSDITEGSLDDGYRKCIRNLASIDFPVEEYGSLGCVFRPESYVPGYTYDYLCIYHPYKGNYKKDVEEIIAALKNKKVCYFGSNADAGGRWITKMWRDFNLPVFESISRNVYLSWLRGAKAIIGNSSSGIIEAPSMKVPTINIGDRQKSRLRAKSIIDCEPTQRAIEQALEKIKNVQPEDYINPYHRPDTLERIVCQLDADLG